jgi:hypothetical protein
MTTRGILGKKIVRVKQSLWHPGDNRKPVNAIDFIELEDGTLLIPFVHEGASTYGVDLAANTTHRVPRRNHNKSKQL